MADNKRAATFVVKLKQAVMIDGDMAGPGEEVELSRREARNLLNRGIAEVVEAEPEDDEPEDDDKDDTAVTASKPVSTGKGGK